MPSDMPSMTPSLAPSDVPSFEPSATNPSAAPSSSEIATLEEPIADTSEQARKISTLAVVTGALAFATVMGAGIYYYLEKTRALEEPDV
jgi:hypothetical protein